jgi:hypothetical protein
LESITIPKSVIGIEERAFCNCRKLRKVIFKNKNTLYDVSAFTDCPSLLLNKRYKDGTYRKLKKQTDFEVEKCPITCEQFTNKSHVILLECGHIFMEFAFREWEKMSNFCPYCRANFL